MVVPRFARLDPRIAPRLRPGAEADPWIAPHPCLGAGPDLRIAPQPGVELDPWLGLGAGQEPGRLGGAEGG